MGELHSLIEARGKAFAVEHNLAPRDLLEAASAYMSDEDTALAFAYSGWAHCALPHRRIAAEKPWEVASERVRLVVEPGRAPSGPDGELEFCGVPFGAEGPSVRKRTVASCTQCPGRGSSGREKSMRSGFKGDGWPQWFVLHAM